MPFMGKTDDGYSELSTIVNSSGTEIDYVLSKTDDGYKRTFTKLRELTGEVPLSFKSITPAPDLTNYRIYGQTSRNLFDVTAQHTIAYETCYQYIISGLNPNLNYTCSTNYNQKDRNDASVYFCGSVTPKNGVWQNEPKTYKPNNDGEIIILIRFIQHRESLPIYDAVVSGDIWIMVNEGDSPLPYEPYGESVGDRTGNLFDEIYPEINVSVKYRAIYVGTGFFTLSGDIPIFANIANLFLLSGNVSSGASSSANGVGYGVSRSVESIDGYITIGYRNLSDVDPRDYNIMLNSGSSPLPYEPYGYKVPVTVEGKNLFDVSTITLGCYINSEGQIIQNDGINTSDFIKVSPNTNYTYKGAVIYDANIIRITYYDQSKNFISRHFTPGNAANGETVTTPSNCEYVKLSYDNVITNLMLNTGSTALPYEPYHAPITTPIYLPEQIRKVGDEAEYIDYGEQKQHRVRVNLFDGFSIHKKVPSVSNGDLVYSKSEGATTDFIAIDNGDITLSKTSAAESNMYIFLYAQDKSYIGYTQTSAASILVLTGNNINGYQNAKYARIRVDIERAYAQVDVMLNIGSTPLPYEPYIENTDLDVTLPALPTLTGTNVLSVGTEVQPSSIYLKGAIKALPSGGDT